MSSDRGFAWVSCLCGVICVAATWRVYAQPGAREAGMDEDESPVDAAPPPTAEAPPSAEDEAASMAALVDPNATAFDLLPQLAAEEGGLTAEEVAERAVEVSPRAHVASAEAGNAERRAGRAYAVFLPHVELAARYTRLSDVELEAPTGTPPEFTSAFPVILDQYSLQAVVRVPVSDYFLTLRDYYASAQRLERFGELQREAEHRAVAYEARREYYELARAMAARELSVHRVAQLERFTKEIEALVEGGELSTVELAQAETRLASARAQAHRALASLEVAEQALRERLKFEEAKPIGIAEPLARRQPKPPAELAGLLERAMEQRAEARALHELIAAREHNAEAAAGERYPDLALVGNVNVDNPNQRFQLLREEFNTSWSVGVELTWSPTELATRENELDDSRLELTRAREDLRALHSRIALEVTRAYENALAAERASETSKTAVEAAEKTLDVRMALMRAGEATSRQVLEAEVDLRAAQLDWVDNVLAAHMAHAALEHATGKGLR